MIADDIRRYAAESEQLWAGAIDGAALDGRGQDDAARAAADACSDLYAEAMAAVAAGDLPAAREALDGARALESEWGDSTTALAALAALGEAVQS